MLSKHQEFLGAESNLKSGFFEENCTSGSFYLHREDHTSKEQESIDNNMSRPSELKLYIRRMGTRSSVPKLVGTTKGTISGRYHKDR